ncbi:MAG TPA: hypothetical protein VMZ66_13425 [Aeromicrobium sp.]|nr:hypothetical protein [Aeromicrobium sp.]
MSNSPQDDERAHLVPLLESFQAAGNLPVSHWFMSTEGGWGVWMRQHLDHELISEHMTRDAFAVHMTFAGEDELRCCHCSVTVYGAGAG